MEKLIAACLREDYVRSLENDFENTRVYEVESHFDGRILYWNSSNSKSIAHEEVLKMITIELLEGKINGSVSDPYSMAEIMFELKDSKY